jgi:hypothetical protein
MKYIYKYIVFVVLLVALSSCSDNDNNISFKKFESKSKDYEGSLVVFKKLPDAFHTVKDVSATKVSYSVNISGDDSSRCIMAAFDVYGAPVLKAPFVGSTYVNVKKTGNEILAVVCKKQEYAKRYRISLKTSFTLDNKTYEYVAHTKIKTPSVKQQ